MSNVFDTAKYILRKSGPMLSAKLHRLCYYSQAWSLVWDNYSLFEEDFQAWHTGPVCPDLFHQIKGKYLVNVNDINGDEDNLTDNQKDTIDKVLEHYAVHDIQWLNQLSLAEDPSLQVAVGQIITKESMRSYYSSLLRAI